MNTPIPTPSNEELPSVLESLLLISEKPLQFKDFILVFPNLSKEDFFQGMNVLKEKYNENNCGFVLYEVAGGFHFRTNPIHANVIAQYTKAKPVRLSRATLETLSIIAYRQPVTRPEIDDIRGVDSGHILRTLLERNLIKILGKREEPGNPLIYGTTPDFLSFFHLNSLNDLPTLREYTELGEESLKKLEKLLPNALPYSEQGEAFDNVEQNQEE